MSSSAWHSRQMERRLPCEIRNIELVGNLRGRTVRRMSSGDHRDVSDPRQLLRQFFLCQYTVGVLRQVQFDLVGYGLRLIVIGSMNIPGFWYEPFLELA